MKDYSAKNYFHRIFEADMVDEYKREEGVYVMHISGDCAWSLESCCRASGYSGGVDLFVENTKELNIDMETYLI